MREIRAKLQNQAENFFHAASGIATEARLFLKDNATLVYKVVPENLIPIFRRTLYEVMSHVTYGQGDMPVTVGIETIAACTRACNYCPVASPKFAISREKRVMADHVFEKIVSELAEIPRRDGGKGFSGNVFLNGYGEPFLDKHLVERTKIAREKLPLAILGMYANGDTLTMEMADQIVAAGIQSVIMTPHDGSFRDEIHQIAKKYPKIFILNEPLQLLSNRGGEVSEIPEAQLLRPKSRCVSATYSLWVAADGTVSLCCNDALLTTKMGNVDENQKLLDVWRSPEYTKIRKLLRDGKWEDVPELCKKCRIS